MESLTLHASFTSSGDDALHPVSAIGRKAMGSRSAAIGETAGAISATLGDAFYPSVTIGKKRMRATRLDSKNDRVVSTRAAGRDNAMGSGARAASGKDDDWVSSADISHSVGAIPLSEQAGTER